LNKRFLFWKRDLNRSGEFERINARRLAGGRIALGKCTPTNVPPHRRVLAAMGRDVCAPGCAAAQPGVPLAAAAVLEQL
jgi:hypothetical protein